MDLQEAKAALRNDRQRLERLGVTIPPSVLYYTPDEFKTDFEMAMDADPSLARMAFDAQPGLTTDPNSAVPSILTTMIDPEVYRVLFSPNMAATILGEVRKGTWLDDTAMFPIAESTGEVSSYGDYAMNGRAGVNTNFPQRQNYLFQVIKQYGERELARAGLARINWVSEIDIACALTLNKFANYVYFFGVQLLQNYGLLNDPNLGASLTPAIKGAGGTAWINSSGQVVATANEIFNDIQSIFYQLVTQSGGIINADSPLVLAMSPGSSVALTATNSFNVNVRDLLEKNFKKIRIETAVQYGVQNTQNPQGIAAGNMVQMLVEEVEGQRTGYVAYSDKMRSFPIIRELSAFRQKVVSGVWGAVLRMTFPIASMIGV